MEEMDFTFDEQYIKNVHIKYNIAITIAIITVVVLSLALYNALDKTACIVLSFSIYMVVQVVILILYEKICFQSNIDISRLFYEGYK